MEEDKSSSDKNVRGGRGGLGAEGGNGPAQEDLFYTPEETEVGWEILEKKEDRIWNEGSKCWQPFPTFIHTRPKDWAGPEESEKLPWED